LLKYLLKYLLVALAIFAFAIPTGEAVAKDGSNHHLVIHVDDNDKGKMNLSLNNAANVTKYYQSKGQSVKIEIVTYGPGLMMLRPDKSPVKDRIKNFAASFENVSFAACGNTMKKMSKKAGKTISVFDFANKVDSGVIQIMKRQDQGWHYLRP
jgi:intracellular sulfur oxidation DsrE/DsrF family protein